MQGGMDMFCLTGCCDGAGLRQKKRGGLVPTTTTTSQSFMIHYENIFGDLKIHYEIGQCYELVFKLLYLPLVLSPAMEMQRHLC